ncbi:hypothetical protein SAMN05216548_11639 [Faunimonas pinastri]|uniref:Nuclease PIN n=1 Tax=Faunimonas pinastri TaxID=1855383 RepID=A0A1H9NJ49_9HYPH|nr:DUF47 domain-containing protein [Faunimonas pinastri]SER36004.1 hypothetical protein SAMN05216548_11639 [Faunimonas pinastri]
MNWFRKLLPKEDRFFTLFEQHARTATEAAKTLEALLAGGEEVPQRCREIATIEHKADDITREVILAIRASFITPFDRGDIKDLISRMDDAVDQMHQTAKAITLFKTREFEPEMREMGAAIVACARLLEEVMPLLSALSRNAAPISDLCLRISTLEGQADDVYDRGMKALFKDGMPDAMNYIVRSQIYDHLEEVIDHFEDIADQIQGIVVEHV